MLNQSRPLPMNHDIYSQYQNAQANSNINAVQEHPKVNHGRRESLPEKSYAPKAPLDLTYKVQFNMQQQTFGKGQQAGFGLGAANAKLVKNEDLKSMNKDRLRGVQSSQEMGRQKKPNSVFRSSNRINREQLQQPTKTSQSQLKVRQQNGDSQNDILFFYKNEQVKLRQGQMIPDEAQDEVQSKVKLTDKEKKKTKFFSNRDLNHYTNIDIRQSKNLAKNRYGFKSGQSEPSFSMEKRKEIQSNSHQNLRYSVGKEPPERIEYGTGKHDESQRILKKDNKSPIGLRQKFKPPSFMPEQATFYRSIDADDPQLYDEQNSSLMLPQAKDFHTIDNQSTQKPPIPMFHRKSHQSTKPERQKKATISPMGEQNLKRQLPFFHGFQQEDFSGELVQQHPSSSNRFKNEVSQSQVALKSAFRDSIDGNQGTDSLFRNKKMNQKISKQVVSQIQRKAKDSQGKYNDEAQSQSHNIVQPHLKDFFSQPRTSAGSPDLVLKEKADLQSPGGDQAIYRSLDEEDFEVEALKPLIPYSMESGLNGNSKTIDTNSSGLGYRSFKALPNKNLQTIDHGSRKQTFNLEPSILNNKEATQNPPQHIPISRLDVDMIRHGSAGVSSTIDQGLQNGSDIEFDQVNISANHGQRRHASNQKQKTLRQKSISTFDKILLDNAVGQSDTVNTSVNRSMQKTRKNRVILPKIMFFNQSQLSKEERETSGRLVSQERMSNNANRYQSLEVQSLDGSMLNASVPQIAQQSDWQSNFIRGDNSSVLHSIDADNSPLGAGPQDDSFNIGSQQVLDNFRAQKSIPQTSQMNCRRSAYKLESQEFKMAAPSKSPVSQINQKSRPVGRVMISSQHKFSQIKRPPSQVSAMRPQSRPSSQVGSDIPQNISNKLFEPYTNMNIADRVGESQPKASSKRVRIPQDKKATQVKIRQTSKTPPLLADPFAQIKIEGQDKAFVSINHKYKSTYQQIQKAKSSEQPQQTADASADDAHLRLTFMKQQTEPCHWHNDSTNGPPSQSQDTPLIYTQQGTHGTIEKDQEVKLFDTPNLGEDKKQSKASQLELTPLMRSPLPKS